MSSLVIRQTSSATKYSNELDDRRNHRLRFRGTSRDIRIDGNVISDGFVPVVRIPENAPGAGARANGHHDDRFGRLLVHPLGTNGRFLVEAAAQQGVLPGDDDDFKALMERVEGLMNQEDWAVPAETKSALPFNAPKDTSGDQVDCGGGIYVDGAALELKVVTLYGNVASRSGPGYGGGLCAVNLPEAGLTASGYVYVNTNTASQTENGIGGGFCGATGSDPP